MPAAQHSRLVTDALAALAAGGVPVKALHKGDVARPGLYAFHASAATWRQLGLRTPRDARLLYVGKAENTLASRDIAGHFGLGQRRAQSPTGTSTLRRSLAALLAEERGYRGLPRNRAKPSHFANYGLSEANDMDLSMWMTRRLRLAVWPHDCVADLDRIETVVLQQFAPPLNISKVMTPWHDQVKRARERLAAEGRAWQAPAGT